MATLYPIPSQNDSGTPFHQDAAAITDGTDQQLLTFTVGAGVMRRLLQARVTSDWDGRFTLKLNGSVIGSGRTGPADRNAPFFWTPAKQLLPGDVFELLFKPAQGVPIGVRVEAQVMGSDS